jgi:UDP-glucose 4-epimerase
MRDMERLIGNEKISFHQFDLRDRERAQSIIKGVDAVIHLAAMTSVTESLRQPAECLANNFESTLSVLEACRVNGVRRLIFASTAAAKGQLDPVRGSVCYSPYGLSKKTGEEMIEMYGEWYDLDYVCLRFFNLYGPYQYQEDPKKNVIGELFRSHLSKQPFNLYGDGEQSRDFVYVEDLAAIIWNILANPEINRATLEVGKGHNHSVNELVECFQEVTGAKLEIRQFPARRGEIVHSRLDPDRSAAVDYRPKVGLTDGLAKTFDWIKSCYQ